MARLTRADLQWRLADAMREIRRLQDELRRARVKRKAAPRSKEQAAA